jgi:acid phosphatase
MLRYGIFGLLLGAALAASAQAPYPVATWNIAPASEPSNLGELKARLKAYHDCTLTPKNASNCYASSLDRQIQRAIPYLTGSVKEKSPASKLALVLDIDETSLSNYEEISGADFAFNSKQWNEWVEEARAPAISGTLKLYQRARQLGVAVFFITGRSESQREATEKNLRAARYTGWTGLIMRTPEQAKVPTIPYKSAAREQIAGQGYRIVLNVGDQWSDLKGRPQAELSVKLPDPFYYIP